MKLKICMMMMLPLLMVLKLVIFPPSHTPLHTLPITAAHEKKGNNSQIIYSFLRSNKYSTMSAFTRKRNE